jgi:hypothetical protein
MLFRKQEVPSEAPLVVVHPYFAFERTGEGCQTLKVFSGMCTPRGYLERLESLVFHHKGPVITLDGADRCKATSERYAAFGRTHDIYMMPGKEETDPTPLHGWSDLFDLLKTFPPRPVKMAGGFLYHALPFRIGRRGCLGVTANQLAKQKIPFVLAREAIFAPCYGFETCTNIKHPDLVSGYSV